MEKNFDLDLEYNLKIPAPLDPHIASITVRTGTNNPNDYFDLLMSVFLGSEYIEIQSGDEKFEIKLSIRKAEVKLSSVNCNLHLLTKSHSDAWYGREVQSDNTASNSGYSLGGEGQVNPNVASGSLTAGAKIEREQSTKNNVEVGRDIMPWRVLSNDTLQIGYTPDFRRPVIGRIVDEDVRIRVTPDDTSKRVGVLARIRVRERWIDIEDISVLKASEKVKSFMNSLMRSDAASQRQKELFGKLLAHLVTSNLQSEDEVRDATFAASAIVFTPRDQKIQGLPSPNAITSIRVDPTAIDSFIAAAPNETRGVLQAYGVDLDEDIDSSKDDAERFQKIWESYHGYVYFPVVKDDLELALSSSFGLKVRIDPISDNDRGEGFRRFWLTVTNSPHETREASEILKILGGGWKASDVAVNLGVLPKGEAAHSIAKLFGYEFSYPTLRRKMKKHAVVTGYGNVVSFDRLAREAGAQDASSIFAGARNRVSIRFTE